jgi:hypothetical protein
MRASIGNGGIGFSSGMPEGKRPQSLPSLDGRSHRHSSTEVFDEDTLFQLGGGYETPSESITKHLRTYCLDHFEESRSFQASQETKEYIKRMEAIVFANMLFDRAD